MPKESVIRDRLTKKLDVLEPGLTLVEVNHKLPNDAGAKGFIDILAKDQVGNIVIIELKRSDQAARQAMFEILKYMPLFRQHHGIPAHRIRCFIVSTTWHELRVAYSEFRRLCETQTLGFAIKVDADGDVLSSEQITVHVEATPAQVFRMHVAYLYDSAKGRDEAFPILRQAYADAGAEGFLQVRLDYNGDSPKVIFPFAAYLVPTRIKDDLLDKLTKESAAELMEAEEMLPEPAAIRENVEDSFLAIVQDSVRDHLLSTTLETSIANPEAFTAMTEGGWDVVSIDRTGPFADPLVTSDAEVLSLIKGHAGDSTVRFGRLCSPAHKLDWAHARQAAANCLRGNSTWEAGFAWFMEYVEKEFPDGLAFLQIYNLLLLPETLYRFAIQNTPDYTPQLALTVLSADRKRQEGLLGTIVWDGKTVPKSVAQVFGVVCGDIHDYYMAKTVGIAWELDQDLMRRHGLEYSLWRLTFVKDENGKDKIEQTKRFVLTDGTLVESAEIKPPSLGDYVDADATNPYLSELFAQIDHFVGR